MYDFIKAQKIWFVISSILVLSSIILLFLWGLKPSIDFMGGSLLQIKFQEEINATVIQEKLKDYGEVQIQPAGNNVFILKMKPLTNDERKEILKKLGGEEQSFESIGPTIGRELRNKAIVSIILVLLAIIAYIAWIFRKVSLGPVPSWFYGLAAVLALIHDVLITVGVFVVLGEFKGIEVNTMFVTALLTIVGFSVHDTIVVYDRIRENLRLASGQETFPAIINKAVNQTLTRSLNTSLTVFLVLIALFLLGGESTKYFVFALMIGIIVGTYSSIFIASPLLLFYQKFKR